MDWIKVSIFTTSEGIEPLSGRLYQLGITGLEIEDEKDFKDFLENNKQYWDYVDDELIKEKEGETEVIAYVSDNAAGHEMLMAIRNTVAEMKQLDDENEFGRLEIHIDNMKEEDWANNWKQYFKPFPVGEKLYIRPSWEHDEPEAGRTVLEIDPESSFGTGQHHTTRLCLELMESEAAGSKMLDMGCGSGILSVAAHMLGAEDVTAVDIDPNAVRIAAENAEKNGFALHTGVGDVIGDAELSARIGGDYDIIVANIVADVIMGMQDILKSKLKREGTLIVSGIIAPRADEVQASLLGAGFVLDRRDQSGDWVAMTLHQA